MRLGAHVDELVHAQQKEIHADVNVDGAHAGHGGADGEAGDGVFRQRRIHDAARPKLIDQAVGGALDGLVVVDVEADDEDAFVLVHFLLDGLLQRLDVADDPVLAELGGVSRRGHGCKAPPVPATGFARRSPRPR